MRIKNNTIHNNQNGLAVGVQSFDTRVFHNNFINNTTQAQAFMASSFDNGLPDGGVYPVNEIIIDLIPDSTFEDATDIAFKIGGRIVGTVSSFGLYQIEVPVNTISEIESVINELQNLSDPRIEGVFRNFLVPTN